MSEAKSNAAVHIYSTLSNDQAYTVYAKAENGNNLVEHVIHVAGKANVADRKTLITPRGVVTSVTAEQAALLGKCDMFKRHVDRGFITVSDKLASGDEVARSLTKADKSAPLTPATMPGAKTNEPKAE